MVTHAGPSSLRLILAVAILMLSSACFRIELGDSPAYSGDIDSGDVDAMVEEELAEGKHAEAGSWLQEPGNILFEGNPQAVQQLIDELYAAGARNVWFTGIEALRDVKISASLVVEMPSDPSVRAELLRIEAEFWGEDPEPDVDQRYISIYLD